jgi:hypothetical protein
MTTTTTITRISATTAALVLLTGAALAGPASAKNGADDPTTSSVSDDSTNRATTDDGAARTAADDSTNRIAADDNPGAGREDRTNRASSKSQARKTKRGDCTATTDWKLKARPRDGRLEAEFEVDSNVVGQRWTYTIRHDGTVKASGARTTKAPSGSFSVEKRPPNAAGVHTISATAKNASTGETCKASLKI